LKIAYDAVTPAEEKDLIALIEASGLSYPTYDAGNRRSSTSYGWKYDYSSDRFVPCPPMHQGFRRIAETAAAFAGVEPEDLAECLLNRYEPGAIIQSHLDKPVWDHVIGISLGTRVTMNFRRKVDGLYEYADAELPPRSMYLLADDARYVFEHSLPPMEGTRWSITFRTFSDEGLRRRADDEVAIGPLY
jgi:alkylated DNA repair dioxygenase AlkB